MINETLLEKARIHVRRWFARRMPAHMLFHDLEHTLAVTRTALGIGRAQKLTEHELRLVELAALFHDTGYALAYAGHEVKGAELAADFLQKNRVPARDIQRIRSLIMATRMSMKPRGPLQHIIRDADSAKAGQADFEEKGQRLRLEVEARFRRKISLRDWERENLAYLDAHRFYTTYAQQRYGAQKTINRAALLARTGKHRPTSALKGPAKERFVERDLSWLSFNERVLQEAQDPRVPLLERIKFLAIYSSNLDEFYRVRVASLRGLAKLKKADRAAFEVPGEALVDRINRKALAQQQAFGRLYRNTLLPALAKQGIRLLRPGQLDRAAKAHVQAYFKEQVAPLLNTATVRQGNAPFIEDRKLYFAVHLRPKGRRKAKLVLLNIPSEELGRFIALPAKTGRTDILILDDAIRVCLGSLFTGHKVLGCHAIKLSRDAELYLDEEFVGNVKDKVRKSLRKRVTGLPSRFLYDASMPPATLRALRALLGLAKQDLVKGGHYHNFSDWMGLPIEGHAALRDKPWPPLQHSALKRGVFRAIAQKDHLLHFPYHDFGQLVAWLRQAARDKAVRHIAITLYRVAEGSAVCEALMEACANGKRVTVFVEVQARFDERSNLFWGEALEKAGARVIYSYEHVKVHCKLCLIERIERGRLHRYAYLGTGNFNERTSRLYADMALLTANPEITAEVAEVFKHLQDRRHQPSLHHLLMAPTSLRPGLETLIDKEIEHALSGRRAEILLKLNSLEDRALIRKLYDASNAGVKVRLIIRGICCLVPGIKGMSANIEAISIVDRYLEHTRVYHFHNADQPLIYLASADWMGRNLDRRIEVAFPVLDPQLKRVVTDLMELQWRDRVKARLIDAGQTNPYLAPVKGTRTVHAQQATYAYIKRL